LEGLTAALNSLSPGKEGEFACPSGTPLHYLVALRYSDAPESEVEAEYHSCNYARTKEHYWEASRDLQEALDAALGG
jgi:hypothetical protein